MIVFVAGVSVASYEKPIADPTGANAYGYVNVGTSGQVKNGGASVYAFTAGKNAWLKDQTIIGGAMLPQSGTTLAFGNAKNEVAVDVNNNTRTDALQSDSLKHGGDPLWHLCGGPNGELQFCDPSGSGSVVDLCSNISGIQDKVPEGYSASGGVCTVVSTEKTGTLVINVKTGYYKTLMWIQFINTDTNASYRFTNAGSYSLPIGAYKVDGLMCEDQQKPKPGTASPSTFDIVEKTETEVTANCT